MESLQTGSLSQGSAQPTFRHGPHEGTEPLYGLVIDYDHHGSGRGEDAPPIWIFEEPSRGLIGVFDGLGGAGGKSISLADGSERTGAWLASRLTRRCVVDVYRELIQQGPIDFTAELRRALGESLSELATQIRATGGGSQLRSRLFRTLPTTMAICSYDLTSNEFTAVWAGDSRVYCLRPGEGLQQVTTDDLKSGADALQNLIEDSPMSNFVSADIDFVLHERQLALRPFTILIAASDGCYGYMRTPLHFEHALLSTMQESTDWADWQERLESRIVEVTGDDSTLSAAAVGWPDFSACRAQFASRADWCAQHIEAHRKHWENVQRLELELDKGRRDLSSNTQELWQAYRTTYEGFALTPVRDLPSRTEQSNDPGQSVNEESP